MYKTVSKQTTSRRLEGRAPRLGQARGMGAAATRPMITMSKINRGEGPRRSNNRSLKKLPIRTYEISWHYLTSDTGHKRIKHVYLSFTNPQARLFTDYLFQWSKMYWVMFMFTLIFKNNQIFKNQQSTRWRHEYVRTSQWKAAILTDQSQNYPRNSEKRWCSFYFFL